MLPDGGRGSVWHPACQVKNGVVVFSGNSAYTIRSGDKPEKTTKKFLWSRSPMAGIFHNCGISCGGVGLCEGMQFRANEKGI